MKLFRGRNNKDLPETQRRVAETFVSTAVNLAGVDFDYSEASVDWLESFVDGLWDPQVTPTEAELDNLTKLMGAYLGEVMIRNVGGTWAWSQERAMPTIEASRGTAFVLDKVYKRQVVGRQESLIDFYKTFKARESN